MILSGLQKTTVAAYRPEREGQYTVLNETFADLTTNAWLVSDAGRVTVSGNELIIDDNSAAAQHYATCLISPNSTRVGLPYDRPFIVEAEMKTTLGTSGLINMSLTGTGYTLSFYITASNSKANVSSPVGGTVSETLTNFDYTNYFKVITCVNPVTKTARFYISYKDSSSGDVVFKRISASTAHTYTADYPTNLQFATSTGSVNVARVRNVKILVPWMIVTGDSIGMGANQYSPVPLYYATPNTIHSMGYWLEQSWGSRVAVWNMALAGKTLRQNAANDMSVEALYDLISFLQPEWALIHAGVNDIVAGYSLAQMQTALGTVLDGLIAGTPNTKIVVDEVLPDSNLSAGGNVIKDGYNAWLQTAKATRSNVYVCQVHDIMEGATADALNVGYHTPADVVHPNLSGYRRMAFELDELIRNSVES